MFPQKFFAFMLTAALAFLFAVPSAQADRILQALDPTRSSVSFSANAGELGAAGSFNDFSGQFLLDTQQLSASTLNFRIDVADVAFEPMPVGNLLVFQNLLQSIPNPALSFQSSKIEQTSERLLRVTGMLRGGNNRQEIITLPVQLQETGPRASVLSGTINKQQFPSFNRGGAPLAVLLDGTVRFRLLFSSGR